MPKERIYGGEHKDEPNSEAKDVVILWHKADVAAHTYENDGYAGNVYIGQCGQTEDGPVNWTTLDRTSINRMVSALRRARNAAFGADE